MQFSSIISIKLYHSFRKQHCKIFSAIARASAKLKIRHFIPTPAFARCPFSVISRVTRELPEDKTYEAIFRYTPASDKSSGLCDTVMAWIIWVSSRLKNKKTPPQRGSFIDQNIPLTKNEGKSPPIKDLPHGRREPEMNALSLSRGKLKMNALSFSRGKLLCHLSKSISGLRRGRFFHSRIWYRAVRSTRISFSDRKRPRKAIIRSNKVIILLLS